MNNFCKKLTIFSIGALGYGLIEVIWRGYTHWSMLSAGGICLLSFSRIGEKLKNISLFFKGIIGSGIITSIELVFGFVFNILLKKNVWDYSSLPLNFKGQICILYSLFWFILSLVFFPFAELLNRKIQTKKDM